MDLHDRHLNGWKGEKLINSISQNQATNMPNGKGLKVEAVKADKEVNRLDMAPSTPCPSIISIYLSPHRFFSVTPTPVKALKQITEARKVSRCLCGWTEKCGPMDTRWLRVDRFIGRRSSRQPNESKMVKRTSECINVITPWEVDRAFKQSKDDCAKWMGW